MSKYYDRELERGFINSILSSPEVIDDVIEKVNINDFSKDEYKKVFDKIQNLYFKEGKVSKTKIMQYVKKNSNDDLVNELFDTSYIMPLEISEIVEELNKYKYKRNVVRSLKKSYEFVSKNDDIERIKSKVQDNIFQATNETIGGNLIHDVEDVAFESLQRLEERLNGKFEEKIRTGIGSLDAMLSGGFTKKHLSILAGRPSMGKTAMALKILGSMLGTSQTPTLFFSLEMERVELMDRLLIQKSKVAADDYYRVKKKEKPPLTKKQRNSIEVARDWIHDKPLKIVEQRGLTIEDIKSLARKTNNLYDDKLGFIVIDYLTEIKVNAEGGRWDKGMASAIRELRNLAGELNCHVMLLHQINRDFKHRSNKKPVK